MLAGFLHKLKTTGRPQMYWACMYPLFIGSLRVSPRSDMETLLPKQRVRWSMLCWLKCLASVFLDTWLERFKRFSRVSRSKIKTKIWLTASISGWFWWIKRNHLICYLRRSLTMSETSTPRSWSMRHSLRILTNISSLRSLSQDFKNRCWTPSINWNMNSLKTYLKTAPLISKERLFSIVNTNTSMPNKRRTNVVSSLTSLSFLLSKKRSSIRSA